LAEFLVLVVSIGLFCGALALAGWLAEKIISKEVPRG
jgi:hypothetical protein